MPAESKPVEKSCLKHLTQKEQHSLTFTYSFFEINNRVYCMNHRKIHSGNTFHLNPAATDREKQIGKYNGPVYNINIKAPLDTWLYCSIESQSSDNQKNKVHSAQLQWVHDTVFKGMWSKSGGCVHTTGQKWLKHRFLTVDYCVLWSF